MAGRIHSMRQLLFDALNQKGVSWPHVMKQIGMFSYTGLNGKSTKMNLLTVAAKQCETLINKHHIYLTLDGRISLAGLSTKTVPIVANAIIDVLKESKL